MYDWVCACLRVHECVCEYIHICVWLGVWVCAWAWARSLSVTTWVGVHKSRYSSLLGCRLATLLHCWPVMVKISFVWSGLFCLIFTREGYVLSHIWWLVNGRWLWSAPYCLPMRDFKSSPQIHEKQSSLWVGPCLTKHLSVVYTFDGATRRPAEERWPWKFKLLELWCCYMP